MLEGWLDFERPIAELEAKIEELSDAGSYKDEINRFLEKLDRP